MLFKVLPLGRVYRTAYDGEGGAGGAGDGGGAGGAGAGAGGAGAGAGAADKKFTQDEVNTFLAREKRRYDENNKKLIQQLEAIQADKKTTDEVRNQLELQLDELRQANMSAEEKTALALKKAQKEAEAKLNEVSTTAKTWQDRHHSLQIGYEIQTAFSAADTVPGSLPMVESFLRPRTRLVEVMDEDGKPTGNYKPVVKMNVLNKDGKPTELDLTIPEAVKAMKDDVDNFGFIFNSTARAGVGGSAGSGSGKKPNVATMSPSQYMEARKKNPAALGLK